MTKPKPKAKMGVKGWTIMLRGMFYTAYPTENLANIIKDKMK